jgi:hypothetical protein
MVWNQIKKAMISCEPTVWVGLVGRGGATLWLGGAWPPPQAKGLPPKKDAHGLQKILLSHQPFHCCKTATRQSSQQTAFVNIYIYRPKVLLLFMEGELLTKVTMSVMKWWIRIPAPYLLKINSQFSCIYHQTWDPQIIKFKAKPSWLIDDSWC